MSFPLSSMTGFGRSAGAHRDRPWSWELRSVNNRGFDLRVKLPPGLEHEEAGVRAAIQAAFKRGAVQASLTLGPDGGIGVSVRTELLDRLLAVAMDLARRIPGAPPPRAEALLALPGVLRAGGEAEPDATLAPAIAAGLTVALAALAASRQAEGARLHALLCGQIEEIEALRNEAERLAKLQPAAQRQRLQDSVRVLLAEGAPVSEDRLAQELALLASRADVREELDRLGSHIDAARGLLAEGVAVGRRLDFLVQELNREANTLCAKSASARLTAVGLRLKAAIEQVREQVQNVE